METEKKSETETDFENGESENFGKSVKKQKEDAEACRAPVGRPQPDRAHGVGPGGGALSGGDAKGRMVARRAAAYAGVGQSARAFPPAGRGKIL
jgi:hypothetical protein